MIEVSASTAYTIRIDRVMRDVLVDALADYVARHADEVDALAQSGDYDPTDESNPLFKHNAARRLHSALGEVDTHRFIRTSSS